MKIKFFWLAAAALLLSARLALAAPATPEEVMTRVQAQYDKAANFRTHFRQESSLKAVNQVDVAQGLMYFKKPCRMRWQYETPPEHKKEFISDGDQVWMYLPQDNMVMVYPLKQVLRSDLVMRFFSGIGEFKRDFTVAWNHPPLEHANLVIDLFPKQSQPELKRLTLTINPQTYLVDRLEFANALGEETKFTFTQTQMNVPLKADFFTFTPPPGVQVVKDAPGKS